MPRFQRPWQRRSRPAPGSQSKKTAKMQAFSPPCVRWRSSCRHVVRQQRLTPRFKTWRRVVLVAGQLRRTASLPLLRILLSTERRMRGAGGLITGGSMKRRSSLRLHDRVSSPGFASRLARECPTTVSSRSASFTGPSKRQRMGGWPQRRRPLLWKSSCDTPKTGHTGSNMGVFACVFVCTSLSLSHTPSPFLSICLPLSLSLWLSACRHSSMPMSSGAGVSLIACIQVRRAVASR